MTPQFVFFSIIVALLIGLSKGGLGGPAPIALLTPLMSQVMPAAQAVGIVLPLLIFADVFALWIYWGTWDTKTVRLMLPMGIVGIIMGTLLLGALAGHDVLFRRILGAFTLTVVIYKIGNESLKSLRYQPRAWHGHAIGWASGFGSALANTGSPPFTAYMLLQNVTPTVFIGTTTLFFAIVNVLKLPGTFLAGVLNLQQVATMVWALPLIPVGVWVGRQSVKIINPKAFEWFMIAVLFVMSLYMLLVVPS